MKSKIMFVASICNQRISSNREGNEKADYLAKEVAPII